MLILSFMEQLSLFNSLIIKISLKQKSELVEGQAYVVAGLMPTNSDSETLYLQARGSSTKWQPLSPLAMECFE